MCAGIVRLQEAGWGYRRSSARVSDPRLTECCSRPPRAPLSLRATQEVPRIPIPLHTLMELTPKADGTMAETRFHVDVDRALRETKWAQQEQRGSTGELRSSFIISFDAAGLAC